MLKLGKAWKRLTLVVSATVAPLPKSISRCVTTQPDEAVGRGGGPGSVPSSQRSPVGVKGTGKVVAPTVSSRVQISRSEEHTSELQSLMRISYAVFCLKKKNNQKKQYT